MYICWMITFAAVYTHLAIYPSVLVVEAWDNVTFVAHTEIANEEEVVYSWSIDGVTIQNIETKWLDLSWDEYISYFPRDAEEERTRTVTVATIVEEELVTDSAQLNITHQEDWWYCGNGIIDLGEECDDGNLVNGDACNEICLCEWMCMSLLI